MTDISCPSWKARGRPREFDTPEELWERSNAYFAWVDANPIKEEKLFSYEGEIVRGVRSTMRPMSIGGLCTFLGIVPQTWDLYRKRPEFIGVIQGVETVIETQQFEGAAANQLNANIISRRLGLADKQEHSVAVTEIERTIVDPKAHT